MAAKDLALVSNILNATLPTATGGKPAAFTNYATTTAMTLKLTQTDSTPTASGTELPNGGGYVTNGTAITTASTPSSAGSSVTLPNMSGGISWTNSSGSPWAIHSAEIIDSSQKRGWFGNFTGDPIAVAIGNTFTVAQNAITATDS